MAVIALSTVGASDSGDLAGYLTTEQGELLDLLRALGHHLVEPSSSVATHYVALDHNSASLRAISGVVPRRNRQLVVFEPRVVIPANYQPRIHKKYGSVISMTPELVPAGTPVLPWPQRDWRSRPAGVAERVTGSTALINANKISLISGSLYGLRRKVIEAFDHEGVALTLAGSQWARRGRALALVNLKALAYAAINRERIDVREWARPLPLGGSVQNVGIVSDKESLLLASEFAVVIENTAGYVSEKLFDAVFAGCVPLYVGPPLHEVNIPDEVAVQLGRSARPIDFIDAVRLLSADRKSAILEAGQAWLRDDDTHARWAMHNALERLTAAIDNNIAE